MRLVSEVSDDGEKGRRLQRVSRLVFWDGPIRGCIASSPSAVWCIATDTRLRDVEGRRGDREPGELNRGIVVGARVRGRWDRARSPPLSSSP